MKKSLLLVSFLLVLLLTACQGDPPVNAFIKVGEKANIKHVQHLNQNDFNVEIVDSEGKAKWQYVVIAEQRYLKGLTTSYIERVDDLVVSGDTNRAWYTLYLKEDQTIDGGEIQTGKNTKTPTTMVSGN